MASTDSSFVSLEDVRKMKRTNSHGNVSDLGLEEDGMKDTTEYRLQAVDATNSGRKVSLWHDISLVHIDPETQQPTPYLNFVCEIPKYSRYAVAKRKSREPHRSESRLNLVAVVMP